MLCHGENRGCCFITYSDTVKEIRFLAKPFILAAPFSRAGMDIVLSEGLLSFYNGC